MVIESICRSYQVSQSQFGIWAIKFQDIRGWSNRNGKARETIGTNDKESHSTPSLWRLTTVSLPKIRRTGLMDLQIRILMESEDKSGIMLSKTINIFPRTEQIQHLKKSEGAVRFQGPGGLCLSARVAVQNCWQ